MRKASLLLRSQMNPCLTRLWDFVAIFLMSLIGAVAMAIFVLLMSASAACAQDLPVVESPATADVDLAIVDYVLTDMGSFHRLSMTVANIGSDSLSYAFDIGMEVQSRADFSQVFARYEEAVSLPARLAPGELREYSFDLVDQHTGVRLSDGEYQLTLWATNFKGTCFADRDWDNNWVDDPFVVAEVSTTSAAESLPATPFALQPNYPNPFNPSTTIPYQLTESVEVELTIFDMLGRKVRTLASGRQAAGAYQVEWDGRDDAGWVVAGGAYFYRLHFGDYAQVRRLMLLN